jgi:subfamily B ATP-binding cassette protein MsbA
LYRLAAPPAWASWTIVSLGAAAAAFEGAGLYLFIPLIQSLGQASTISTPFGQVLTHGLQRIPAENRIIVLVAAICLAIALKNALGLANTFVTRFVDGTIAHRLRLRIVGQVLFSGVDSSPAFRRSDAINIITTESWKVSTAFSLLHRLAICLATTALFGTILLLISAKMTVIALTLMGAAAVAVRAVTRRASTLGEAVVEDNKQFGHRMWLVISELPLIRAFTRETFELDRLRLASERVRSRLLHLDMLWALPGPLSEVLSTLVIGVLVLTSARISADFASLAAFLAILYRLQSPWREVLSSKVALDGLRGAVDEVARLIDQTREPHLSGGSATLRRLKHGIALDNVSFRYAANDAPALDAVTLFIPHGKTTAIIGPSGSGKSSLLSLLIRFHDPSQGEIRADGTPLPSLDLAGWRGRIGLMTQDVRILNDTVAANIAYGDLDAPARAVRRAAAIAGAHDFIAALPEGYETRLGDHGVRLSGGQRQRIALARTVLRDPEILLLDEPTNALDGQTELEFQKALEAFGRGRTVVVVAHRLSTVRNADQIVVLDRGRVIECGPRAAMLAEDGYFARLSALEADQRSEAV